MEILALVILFLGLCYILIPKEMGNKYVVPENKPSWNYLTKEDTRRIELLRQAQLIKSDLKKLGVNIDIVHLDGEGGLSRDEHTRNMDTNPKTDKKTADFASPKPVRPNTTTTIKMIPWIW